MTPVRRLVRLALPMMALAIIVAGLWPRSTAQVTNEERVVQVASRIRCPFCNGESIADAPSGVAQDLERIIAEQVAAGMSNDEIFAYFEARYGEAALMDPPLGGWGWVLWAAPLAALGAGAVAISRRRRVGAQPGGAGEAADRRWLDDRLAQIEADIADLDRQLAAGEIEEAQHRRLADVYAAEAAPLRDRLGELEQAAEMARRLAEAEERLAADPGDDVLVAEVAELRERLGPEAAASSGAGRRRTYLGAAIVVVGAFAASWGVVQAADEGSRVADVPTPPPIDLDSITTEQLEQVVARNPEVVGMRLALANLYFAEGDVMAAVVHYGKVLERERHPEALARLGYISWQVDDPESAEAYLQEALERLPDYPQAQWWLAQVRLYALDDPDGAVAPLEALLASSDVPDDVRQEAEALLAEAKAS